MAISTDAVLAAIRAAMPAHAEIQVVPGLGAFNVQVSWRLNDDPERPNKMSKTISICVSHEAAQDFASLAPAKHNAAYKRLAKFLAARLANFDANHTSPRCAVPPVEKWMISSEVLLGD